MKSPGNIARYLLIVTLGLSACSSVAFGQTSSNRWSGNGPYGGAIRWFAIAQAVQAATRASVTEPTGQQVSRAVANGRVAFVSSEGNGAQSDIYTMNPDGSDRKQLTFSQEYESSPVWSPDGTKIAFARSSGSFSGIYVMNADGTNQTRTNNRVLEYSVDWSPDSTRIVFGSYHDGSGNFIGSISVMNADGSNLQRLTNYPGYDYSPKWSPDGTKIAFVRGDDYWDQQFNISMMNADGTNQTRFSDHPGQDADPRWSPDGTKIAFISTRDTYSSSPQNYEIYVRNADGSNVQRLTNNPTGDADPRWSPDGTKIAFVRTRVGTPQCPSGAFCSYEIYVMNANGTNQTRLTDSPAGDRSPIFSPDSTKIAFISHRDNNGAIYVMNADGSSQTLLTNTAAGALDWQALSLTSPSCPNPIDCAEFFVRQHYRDFLNREPDTPGLTFWTNEITSSGSDAQCVEAKRVNVSAAFFLSIEFQQTGYLVYKTYAAAFGATRIASTVPLTRSELLPNVQSVAYGVVVGATGWEAQLEANQTAYFNEFVQRPNFVATYPPTMTSAQYVDSLNANAGGALTTSERDQLVNELSSGAKTRAQVLRAVAENAEFTRAHFNRAFVLMQYFGYLRRNPNDFPDNNFDGYNFWLTKLDQFNGNFVQAEMVEAFITSIEYHQRFGP